MNISKLYRGHVLIGSISLQGCLQELEDFVQDHLLIIGTIGVAISCIQVKDLLAFSYN